MEMNIVLYIYTAGARPILTYRSLVWLDSLGRELVSGTIAEIYWLRQTSALRNILNLSLHCCKGHADKSGKRRCTIDHWHRSKKIWNDFETIERIHYMVSPPSIRKDRSDR